VRSRFAGRKDLRIRAPTAKIVKIQFTTDAGYADDAGLWTVT